MSARDNPDRHLCAWTAYGRRCGFAGSVTESTTGSERWYCIRHYRCRDQAEGDRIVQDSMQYRPPAERVPAIDADLDRLSVEQLRARCRALMASLSSGTLPALDWKQRLRARHAAGEELLPIQLQMAD